MSQKSGRSKVTTKRVNHGRTAPFDHLPLSCLTIGCAKRLLWMQMSRERGSCQCPGRGTVCPLPGVSDVGNIREVPRDGSNVPWKGAYGAAGGFN